MSRDFVEMSRDFGEITDPRAKSVKQMVENTRENEDRGKKRVRGARGEYGKDTGYDMWAATTKWRNVARFRRNHSAKSEIGEANG
jgi:hypothetical protein